MRGKAYKGADQTTRRGITPAYAGKRNAEAEPDIQNQDHPRVCGEKHLSAQFEGTPPGSPPRMRGKEFQFRGTLPDVGITPAYAGKSQTTVCFNNVTRDHPRVCGEKVIPCTPGLHIQGSPPRMRGKEKSPKKPVMARGITPAYAGKSRAGVCIVGDFGDHPRVCGEKDTNQITLTRGQGSPPRMRGKVKLRPSPAGGGRITPAYAGKRVADDHLYGAQWDHPRVCGEKDGLNLILLGITGSPPRMRGKGWLMITFTVRNGITPAYAGKSTTPRRQAPTLGDHPRVCGEKNSRGHHLYAG